MSGALKFNFGPLPDLRFDVKVGSYLRTSPSGPEAACLREFLANLQKHPIPAGRIGHDECMAFPSVQPYHRNKNRAPGRGVITNIHKDITSDITSLLA